METLISYADDNIGYHIFSFQEMNNVLDHLIPICIQRIKALMDIHFLKLNEKKTEIMVFGSKSFQREQVMSGIVTLSGVKIPLSNQIKYLGVHLDSSVYGISYKQGYLTLLSS